MALKRCGYKYCKKKIETNGTRKLYCSKSHKDKAYRLRLKALNGHKMRRYNEMLRIETPKMCLKKWGVQYGDLWIIPDPPHNSHVILCGNWLDTGNLERLLKDKKIGLCIVDPPYTHGQSSTASWQDKGGLWADKMNNAAWYAMWFAIVRDKLAKTGALWNFCSWRMLSIIMKASDDCKWAIANAAIWDKKNFGPGYYLRYQYEMIALFPMPDYKIPNRSLSDIWQVPWSSTKPHYHRAEKPPNLYKKIILESAIPPGSVIFDGFCGSGTMIEAAAATGHSGYGAEYDPLWVSFILERMSQKFDLKPQLMERIS